LTDFVQLGGGGEPAKAPWWWDKPVKALGLDPQPVGMGDPTTYVAECFHSAHGELHWYSRAGSKARVSEEARAHWEKEHGDER